MTADTSERGLDLRICEILTGQPWPPGRPTAPGQEAEGPAACGAGWSYGSSGDYDREYCVDLAQLSAFLSATQPEIAALSLDGDTPRAASS